MQSVEEFMREFFDERITVVKQEQANRLPFRRKFFAEGTPWESRETQLRSAQLEKVVEISKSDTKADVVTSTEVRKGRFFPRRYRLQACTDGWRIFEIEQLCPDCRGKAGNHGCPQCQGTGWTGPGC